MDRKGKHHCYETRWRKINLGKGSLPILKAINNDKVICVWENENEIHTAVLSL